MLFFLSKSLLKIESSILPSISSAYISLLFSLKNLIKLSTSCNDVVSSKEIEKWSSFTNLKFIPLSIDLFTQYLDFVSFINKVSK